MAADYDTSTGLRALKGDSLISDIDAGFLALATDMRRAANRGLQEGVSDAGSFMVTQRGSGANMSVDVAANSGTGAYVADDGTTLGDLTFVPSAVSVSNLVIGTANASLPRIDRIVLGLDGTLAVVAGTATSGATLNNLTGAAAVPSSKLLLADVLVGASAPSITNSVIRDRRPWARGAYAQIVRTSNASAGSDYTGTTASMALLDATNLQPRIECSGAPMIARLVASASFTTTAGAIFGSILVDGSGVDTLPSSGSQNESTAPVVCRVDSVNTYDPLVMTVPFTPTAGSHLIGPAFAFQNANGWNIRARSGVPLIFEVMELARPSTANNTTTTG